MRALLVGVAQSVAAVAAMTGLVYALRPIAPTLSLGVLYVVAVVAIALLRGIVYAIPVSVASMLTFNFLFLPPLHTFALRESANWVALGVYVVTAVLVAELAARARRLARAALEADALRDSDRVKTAVLQAVSHDLRSPLTAIRTSAEVLESPQLELAPSDRRELVDTIRLEARRLERLVGNLLDLSRLEAGAARRRPELWTVDDLLGRALEQLGAEGRRVDVELETRLPAVRVDAAQIERVLANLLENALKFSPPGDPVDVGVTAHDGVVTIRVRDHGPGVAESDRERIFRAFERGDSRGNGLGLAIARGFAEANGGSVRLVPDEGGGATFELALPGAHVPVELLG
jgi:two-component system sensor histidine kinase KdpD